MRPPITHEDIAIDFGGIFQAFGDGAGGKIKPSAAFGAGGECLSSISYAAAPLWALDESAVDRWNTLVGRRATHTPLR
jgi:hypothetical protein